MRLQLNSSSSRGLPPTPRRIVDKCAVQIHNRPVAIVLATIALFVIAPVVFLKIYPLELDSNPEKGFDTKETAYSGPRLAWTQLQPHLLQGSRVIVEPASHNNRSKRSWAEELVASLNSVACYEEPIPAMDYLSQFIITVPEYESIYQRNFLAELCHLHEQLDGELRRFSSVTPYRNIWHLPNYFACLAPTSRLNCSYLTDADLIGVRQHIEECLPHRRSIFECRRACGPQHIGDLSKRRPTSNLHNNQRPHSECIRESCTRGDPLTGVGAVPENCTSQMMFDLLYRILPRDLMVQPLHLNAFLPIYTYASYRLQGFPVGLDAYVGLEEALKSAGKRSTTYKLKGILMDTKRDLLLSAAVSDSWISLLAAACVFALVVAYSLSLAFSLAVVAQLTANVLTSLAIYRLFNREFPLLNLITFVLLIAIGSDGAFILFNAFPQAERLNAQSFLKAWRHTASTMFLTSFSTVVPFLLNIFSSVIAFRSFGLFAGLTLISNYALLISFLPAFMVLQAHYLNRWLAQMLPSSAWFLFPTSLFPATTASPPASPHPTATRQQSTTSCSRLANGGGMHRGYSATTTLPPAPPISLVIPAMDESSRLEKIQASFQTLLYEVLPTVLIQGRYIWISSLGVVFLLALHICLTQLRLPQYNPLQLFVASNAHEYYDNNAERVFHFVSAKLALPLIMRMVWGIEPVHSTSHFDPKQLSPLRADPHFHLSSAADVRQLAKQLERLRGSPLVLHEEKFWPERYLDWSLDYTCKNAEDVCCNFHSPLYSDTYLDYCLRLSTAELFTQYNDTPIYHNTTFELVGYTALLPTRLRYSHRFANLSRALDAFGAEFSEAKGDYPASAWYTTEWALMSTWFDLQRSIIADCRQSTLVSFGVVLVFAAVMLRSRCVCAMLTIAAVVVVTVGTVVFLGWEVGVLEGVILVLVVGLSFDYTLHYGAAVPRGACPTHAVHASVRKTTVPVFMAAMTSIAGGAVMLLAQTHAFFQVAVFLTVCTAWSFIYATFLFLPMLYVFLEVQHKYMRRTTNMRGGCHLCKGSGRPSAPNIQLCALRQQQQQHR